MTETRHDALADAPTCAAIQAIRDSGSVLKRRISCFCVLIVCAVGLLIIAVVYEQRSSALDRAKDNAANLSAAFEEQVRRVMDNVSGAMDLVIQRILADGKDFQLSDWTRQIRELTASTVHVGIIGPDGRLAASTLDPDPLPLDLSDREHFRVHRDDPNAGLFIGKPVRGRLSQMVTIQVTKRITRPDGSFGGVLVFAVDPEFLTGLHRKIDLGQTGSIALVGQDTVVRARFTTLLGLDSANLGKAIPGTQLFAQASHAESGDYISASVLDGLERLYHWRAVAGYPLYVNVGLGKAEVLRAANRQAKMIIALGAIALALPLVMVLMLNHEINRRVHREIALQMEDEKLRSANESLISQHMALLATSSALAHERWKLTQANAELALAKSRAEEASRAKSAFLANMSHELRTPLNAIIGFAEIIRDRLFGDDMPRYSEYAADIQLSGVHLLNIINGVLDVAKIEAGKFALHESVEALDKMIDESLAAVRLQAAEGGIEVRLDLPEQPLRLHCDETRFKQIVINLLSNAIKFTPAGGAVQLRAEREEGGDLRLSISDNGIGMSEEEIDTAFELFRQVDNRLARRFAGTGLGLPLAVQLAALHGAKLELKSAPGAGTTVSVRFPAARIVDEALPPPSEEEADRRIARRDPVKQLVFICSDHARFETRTVDLSETGVRLERIRGLSQGDRVRIDLGAQIAEGIIVWQNPNHIGVKFIDAAPGEATPNLHDAA